MDDWLLCISRKYNEVKGGMLKGERWWVLLYIRYLTGLCGILSSILAVMYGLACLFMYLFCCFFVFIFRYNALVFYPVVLCIVIYLDHYLKYN